jgi:phage N-6-adenine-methyltransferase
MPNVHFSSRTHEWSTPQDLFDRLNAKYRFTLDVCATPENAKCARFFTKEQDGLNRGWGGERVWCNPPYGRMIWEWVHRCSWAAQPVVAGRPDLAVMLLPARTDTRWWHDYVTPFGKVEFIRGRLKFGGHKNSAPFPSAIVLFGDS